VIKCHISLHKNHNEKDCIINLCITSNNSIETKREKEGKKESIEFIRSLDICSLSESNHPIS
jgi:hypothetical protein